MKHPEHTALENILGVLDQYATEEHRFTLFTLGALSAVMQVFLIASNSVILLQTMHVLYELSWHPDGFDPIYGNKEFILKLGSLITSSHELDCRSSAMSTLYPAAGMISTHKAVRRNQNSHFHFLLPIGLIEPVLHIIVEQIASPDSVISNVAFELLGRLCITSPDRGFTPRSIELSMGSLRSEQNVQPPTDAIAFLEQLTVHSFHRILCPYTLELVDLAVSSAHKMVRQFCRGMVFKLAENVPESFEKLPGSVRKLTELRALKSSRAAKACKKLSDAFSVAFDKLGRGVTVPPVSTECSMEFLVGNALYSDMTLIIQESRVPVHRCVLHGRSAYFRALFESGMQESERRELKLHTEHSVTDWLELLRFIYTDSCRITTSNVAALIQMADLYSMSRLSALCESFLATTLAEDEVFSILSLALDSRMLQLATLCVQFVVTKMDLSQRELTEEELEILEAAGV